MKSGIVFISTMSSHPWGGSEFLWAGAAKHLVRNGHKVGSCLPGWRPTPRAVSELKAEGAWLFERHDVSGFRKIARHVRTRWGYRILGAFGYERWLRKFNPDLVCVSCGNFKDGLWCLEHLVDAKYRFAVIVHANAEFLWPKDKEADRLRAAYGQAHAVYFVSDANRQLLQKQLAIDLPQASVVRNPFNVPGDLPASWPEGNGVMRLACIGRLEPDAKGQDLLFEVLSKKDWRNRPLHVTLFGDGYCSDGLKRLAQHLDVEDRVTFSSPVSNVSKIWENHHALVLPSRYEGLPLVLVEAALMGRMAIVTDVAGNCEIVEDEVTGFVAKAANSRELELAMERAWDRRADWEEMGQLARARVRELVPEDPCATFAETLLGISQA